MSKKEGLLDNSKSKSRDNVQIGLSNLCANKKNSRNSGSLDFTVDFCGDFFVIVMCVFIQVCFPYCSKAIPFSVAWN
jgi:hypothetical protein